MPNQSDHVQFCFLILLSSLFVLIFVSPFFSIAVLPVFKSYDYSSVFFKEKSSIGFMKWKNIYSDKLSSWQVFHWPTYTKPDEICNKTFSLTLSADCNDLNTKPFNLNYYIVCIQTYVCCTTVVKIFTKRYEIFPNY